MVTNVATDDPPARADSISILLVDDHEVVRNGLRMVLEAEDGLEVIAEASDLETARRYVGAHRPRVLVLDLNLPEGSSLPAIPELRERSPETAVVVLTMQQDPAFAREAMRAGALGYVLKHSAGSELVDAVRAAAAGETYLNPKLGAQLAAAPAEETGPPDGLTEREVEILRLIGLGHTNTEIAERLYLSVRTVESHRAHIQQKTGRTSRSELVRYALDHGLVE
jgi:two-component system, NarL family, response regulator NreC